MRIEEEQRCFDSHKIHVAKTNRVHVIDLYRHAYREQRPLTRPTHTRLHFLIADTRLDDQLFVESVSVLSSLMLLV